MAADTTQDILKLVLESTLEVLKVGIYDDAGSQITAFGGNATQDSAAPESDSQMFLEAAEIDGAVLPNAVDEGDSVRGKGSLHGVQYSMLTSKSGDKSPYDSINNILSVLEDAPPIDRNQYLQIQSATAPADNNENQVGGDISTDGYNAMSIGVDYVNGDETKCTITIYKLLTNGGTAVQTGTWGSGANATYTKDSFDTLSDVDDDIQIPIDVSDCSYVQIFAQMADGTPTGTIAVEYALYNNA